MDAVYEREIDRYMLEHPYLTRNEAQERWQQEMEPECSTLCIDPVTSDAANILMKRRGGL